MASTPAVEVGVPWSPRLISLWVRLRAWFPKISVNRTRTLRLCESLALGEKRMVAVVECDNQRYLLAATPQSISLLQALGPARGEEKSGNEL
jgi:flagellar biogenesis protein FliO